MSSFCRASEPDVVQRTLNVRLRMQRAKHNLKWGIVWAALAVVLWYDINTHCAYESSFWFMLEYAVLILFAWNIMVCFLRYLFYTIFTRSVKGTKAQRCLLTVNDQDPSFEVVAPVVAPATSDLDTSSSSSIDGSIISWGRMFTESRATPFATWAFNRAQGRTKSYCTPNQSWSSAIFNRSPFNRFNRSPLNRPTFNCTTFNSPAFGKNFFNSSSSNNYFMTPRKNDSAIPDRRELDNYLRDYDRRSTSMCEVPYEGWQTLYRPVNSFWNYYNTSANLLHTSIYQVSPPASPSTPSKQVSSTEENDISIIDYTAMKRVPSDRLSQDVANLRMWFSSTILQRLAKEFNSIDESFQNRGFNDMRIGNIGLERLKKTAENLQFVNLCMPRLPLILPFLDMSSNQEYLVQRIKDLAKGSCIADYRWNSGSAYHGLEWDEHLPTDSAILFHLFCVYIDSQLLPLPQGSGRPFYHRYVIEGDEKRSLEQTMAQIKNRAHCAILVVNPLKPRFNFITTTEVHNAAYDCNNLFYVIIQFLIYLRAHHNSSLEGVNLGGSGINIMCVIDG